MTRGGEREALAAEKKTEKHEIRPERQVSPIRERKKGFLEDRSLDSRGLSAKAKPVRGDEGDPATTS